MKGRPALHQLNAVLSPVHSILMDSKESWLHRHVGSGEDVRGWGRWFQPHDALMTQNSKSMCGKSDHSLNVCLGSMSNNPTWAQACTWPGPTGASRKSRIPEPLQWTQPKWPPLFQRTVLRAWQVLRHAPAGSV